MGLLIPAPRYGFDEYNFSGRPTTTWGTTLTASASIHTLGTTTQIIAATAEEYDFIVCEFSETSGSATLTDQLTTLYIGAGGSEKVLIPTMYSGYTQTIGSTGPGYQYRFPLRIPRGSRISGAMQALISADTVVVRVKLYKTGQWAGSGVEAVGADTANSRGTSVGPGTTSDGTFTALGTTTNMWRYVCAMSGGTIDTTQNVSVQSLDLGVGSALIPGLENFYQTNTSGEIEVPSTDGRYVTVPAGTALQARLQSHTTDTEGKYVIAHGVY